MIRYTYTMDAYLWAENEEEAIKRANKIIATERKEHDNQANLLELYETPFATLTARKINLNK